MLAYLGGAVGADAGNLLGFLGTAVSTCGGFSAPLLVVMMGYAGYLLGGSHLEIPTRGRISDRPSGARY